MFSKRFFIFVITAVIISTAAFAQSTVEESYLRESIELMIIRETARSNTRDQKLIALEYIQQNIERNGANTSDEVRQTLDFLAREGKGTVTRENNRVINNYPDIRRQAAKYLGQMKTPEAQKALYDIILDENEPTVLQEAIKSLGEIGKNENNETINRIVFVVRSFNRTNPDDIMALATIDAFEKIANYNNGIRDPEAVKLLNEISTNSGFKTVVRERARQLLAKLRTYGG